MQIVRFLNGKDIVYGTLHLPKKGKKHPIVILAHGHTANRHESHFMLSAIARELAKSGIAGFVFDFRGSGESSLDFSQMTVGSEISDIIKAFEYIGKRKEIDPRRIGIVGMSLGGFVAASALKYINPASLCLMNTPAESINIMRETLKKWKVKNFPKAGIDRGGFLISKNYYDDRLKRNNDPVNGIKTFRNPLLIVRSEKDETVGPENAMLYFDNCPSQIKEIHVVRGADHCLSSVKYEKEIISVIKKWFKKTLGDKKYEN